MVDRHQSIYNKQEYVRGFACIYSDASLLWHA